MDQMQTTTRQETASLFAQIKQQAPNFFAVYNNNTGEILGHLADLSTGGMKLISTSAFPTNRIIPVRIDLPREVNGHDEITVTAKTVWCNPRSYGGLYDIGLHFEDVSRADLTIIEQLLSILSILVRNSFHVR
jgi:c-di-GMP-binding flagellar brake protein YcgR